VQAHYDNFGICLTQALLQLPGRKLSDREVEYREVWYDAAVKSLGNVFGKIMSLTFDGYGSLRSDNAGQSILGPLIEPIASLHRHRPLADMGPWPAAMPLAPHLALTVREVQWLESAKGHQLFDQWRAKMHPDENRSRTLPAFVELVRTLVDIVPHMYSLFPLPEGACRPALFHPDFHSSNILVSHTDPTVVTGVVDWEFTSILPLWAAYTVPPTIRDNGDKYELDPEWRTRKAHLRMVFAQAVVQTCPDAAILTQAANEQTERSIRGLSTLVKVATTGVSLYRSFKDVRALLVQIRDFVSVGNEAIVEKLDHLVTIFSQSV
jgi:hypothetical protein